MAVNPAVVKAVVTVVSKKENRQKLIIGIVISLVLFLFIITLPIYLLTHPFEAIKAFFSDDNDPDLVATQTMRDTYSYNQQGQLVFHGIYPIPIEGDYTVTSEFGNRVHPITGEYKLHTGLDLVGPIHCNVLSIEKGEIVWAGVRGGYGNCVNIKHTNESGETFYSFYAHLSKIYVEKGQSVIQGQVIGLQGGAKTDPNPGSSTGSHLHFEIRLSENGDFQNPREYLFSE